MPLAALVLLLVAGCAEEAPGPQFAGDPLPSRTPTSSLPSASPVVTTAPATPVPVATPASFATLVPARGAASNVFVVSEKAVWMVSSQGEDEQLALLGTNETILAADPAPTADSIVLLVQEQNGRARTLELRILDAEGNVTSRTSVPAQQGTPGAGDASATATVDWSPQGNRILLKVGESSLFETDAIDLDLQPLDINVTSIVNPAWSPTGESIAFLSPTSAGRGRGLFVYNVGNEELTEAVRPGPDRFVVEFAWLPDGISLAFTEGGELAGAVTGIDLWKAHANSEDRTLVASAGTVAPVARIAQISPSPDGRSIAYTVQIPGPGRPTVDSIWVRDLASGVGFRVQLPPVQTIEQIDWTNEGLVISVVTRGTGQQRAPVLALFDVSPTMDVSILWAAPVAVASPVAGTPVAATPFPQA